MTEIFIIDSNSSEFTLILADFSQKNLCAEIVTKF